jgi:predicted aspartyl protease
VVPEPAAYSEPSQKRSLPALSPYLNCRSVSSQESRFSGFATLPVCYKQRMKKLLVSALSVAVLAPFSAHSQEGSGTLAGLLSGQGLVGAKLERRFGNHLFIPVSINNKKAALMIDTGAPVTIIDKNSAGTFGLKVETTTINVAGIFGKRWEHYGTSKAQTIAVGNCVVTNVPVALADESDMNADISRPATGSHIPTITRLPHIHGLLGAREMAKFGMVIDCTRQMLYINPNGPSPALSQKLAGFLAGRGFTRIPMRLNSTDHFDVPGALNGRSTRFIVDTGASTTLVDKKTAVDAGTSLAATRFIADAGGGKLAPLGTGIVELRVGDFTIPKAEVVAVNVSGDVLQTKNAAETNAGLIGAEYLAFNFAVIDVGGMALYLRHAESR